VERTPHAASGLLGYTHSAQVCVWSDHGDVRLHFISQGEAMSNGSQTTQQPQAVPGTATKLIRAAALASMLVPLGAVVAEAATITCISTSFDGSCDGTGVFGSGGELSNTWKFFAPGDEETDPVPVLLYTLEISGAAGETFELDVQDRVVDQFNEFPVFNIPNAECIPMFDQNSCVIFDIFVVGEATQTWVNGYYATMTWFGNEDPISTPPEDGRNHIFKADDGIAFNEQLTETEYDEDPTPLDPALGGRGNNFSSLIGARTVPEPGTLLLFGAGAAAAMLRRRRRPTL
jgi:hypothetical protein